MYVHFYILYSIVQMSYAYVNEYNDIICVRKWMKRTEIKFFIKQTIQSDVFRENNICNARNPIPP